MFPRRKYSVSNPLHQLLSKPPGLSVHVVLVGWQFFSASAPLLRAVNMVQMAGLSTAHKSSASSSCFCSTEEV